MINKDSLFWFIFIFGLNSRLSSCNSYLWRSHFCFLFFLSTSHHSIALHSRRLLMLMLSLMLPIELVGLLLYYGRRTDILLQVLLILFIFINTWSEIWHFFGWHNLLSLHFDVRTFSWSIFILILGTSRFLATLDNSWLIIHMCLKRNSPFMISFKLYCFSLNIWISVSYICTAGVIELFWSNLVEHKLILFDFTLGCCWSFPFLGSHNVIVGVQEFSFRIVCRRIVVHVLLLVSLTLGDGLLLLEHFTKFLLSSWRNGHWKTFDIDYVMIIFVI